MGSITGNFTSDQQLHPKAQDVLLEAFKAGWTDPAKLHHSARHLNQLLISARESYATHLAIAPELISFIGEPSLGFHLGINGFSSIRELYLPATSRKEIFAATADRKSVILPVDLNGGWSAPDASPGDLLITNTINLETGAPSPDISNFEGTVFVDASATPDLAIPENWSSALWDATTWRGPRGLALFALRSLKDWKNPLPHLDSRLVPGGVNPALVIAGAVALEATMAERESELEKIAAINSKIRHFISAQVSGVDLASPQDAHPDRLSFSILYIQAEQLLEEMEKRGFLIDSGSACVSENLEPSHVLAAMGRLTHGNIRLRLNADLTEDVVDAFLYQLKDAISAQRGGA